MTAALSCAGRRALFRPRRGGHSNQRGITMTNEAKLRQDDLRQFTGSEQWYRHGINRKVLFTDGAKYVADTAGAYWLLDEIAVIQPYDKCVAAEEFQFWKLAVRPDHTATLTCRSEEHTSELQS